MYLCCLYEIMNKRLNNKNKEKVVGTLMNIIIFVNIREYVPTRYVRTYTGTWM